MTFIESLPPKNFSLQRLEEIRRAGSEAEWHCQEQPSSDVLTRQLCVSGPEDGPEVPVWIYEPIASAAASRAALLHIHGGGYFCGDARSEVAWSQFLAAELGCVVVAPDYRLAPEHTHPLPLYDCYAALSWLKTHAAELRVDKSRIGVYGGSAGGGLAAALALLARDRGEIQLCFQCLLYPMLDDRTSTEADPNPYAGEYAWTRADNAFGWKCLLGHEPGGPSQPAYAAAGRASDLGKLPPTFIWVGALDLFVDESMDYAGRLIRAGVSTELHVYPGVTHANILKPEFPSSRQCRSDILRVLKRALV